MSSIEEIRQQHWDCLVVGTGVGGATLGHALAKARKRVLFLEKGRVPFLHTDTLRGAYPEMGFPHVEVPTTARHAPLLAQAGRCYDEFRDGPHNFIPFIGCGGGGSSALYGMAMERFFPADFEPRQHFPEHSGSSLPDAWPIRYADLAPYYQRAEELYRVAGRQDPLRPKAPELLAPPSLSPRNAELFCISRARDCIPTNCPRLANSFPDANAAKAISVPKGVEKRCWPNLPGARRARPWGDSTGRMRGDPAGSLCWIGFGGRMPLAGPNRHTASRSSHSCGRGIDYTRPVVAFDIRPLATGTGQCLGPGWPQPHATLR